MPEITSTLPWETDSFLIFKKVHLWEKKFQQSNPRFKEFCPVFLVHCQLALRPELPSLSFPPLFLRDVSWSDLMSSTIQVWSQFVLNCDLSTLSGLWWPMHNLVNTLDLHLCFVLVLKSTGRSHKETRHGIQGSLYRGPVKWTKTNKLHFSKAESLQMCVFLWTQFWIYYLVGSKTDYSSFISS